MKRKHTVFGFILGVVLVAAKASAAVVLYDFPWANGGGWEEGSNGITKVAQTFTTGSSAVTLTDVEVWIRNAGYPDDSSSEAGTLSIDLYATDVGSGYMPTVSLYSIVSGQSINEWWDNGPGAGNGADYTGLNYALSANTTYAIVFAPSGSTTIGWKYPSSGSPSSDISPTPTFHNWEWDGSSWADGDPAGGFSMKVTGNAIPEPTTGLIFALGAGLAAVARRRQPRYV